MVNADATPKASGSASSACPAHQALTNTRKHSVRLALPIDVLHAHLPPSAKNANLALN